MLTVDEKFVENHFQTTHHRDESVRFIVQLPKQRDSNALGNSYHTALQRFLRLEARFKGDQQFKERYTRFIEEYNSLNHMEEISNIEDIQHTSVFYLPHHAVIKDSKVTSKIRVVFDASIKTTTGISLNEILMTGPTIQDDIFTLLTRFRQHKYVLTSDIVKMYRQILVSASDANLQLILWRNNPCESLKTYRLKTLTYRTASAPFFAIRCLQELARSHYNMKVQRTILKDDMLTGSDDLNELLEIRNHITHLLASGGFTLEKWASDNQLLLNGFSSTDSVIIFDKSDTIKTLGLHWIPQIDMFCIQIPRIKTTDVVSTKRDILSIIAKMFDPLGLLSPIIVKAKMIMQQLRELHISWDDVVPSGLQSKWNQFCSELNLLDELQISRRITIDNAVRTELHGFADDSELAYGASIYLRSIDNEGRVQSMLIASKGKIAPLKRTTLPKLELCAAHLLAKLYTKTTRSFVALSIQGHYLWSDSTIVLCWIQKSSRSSKTFVSSRVAEIQELTSNCLWGHVLSAENPADVVSRGLTPKEILHCQIWWSGPAWLLSTDSVPHQNLDLCENEDVKQELKFSTSLTSTIQQSPEFLTRFSSFAKLKRVIAYCLRFHHNSNPQKKKFTGYLKPEELRRALYVIIRLVQGECFSVEIDQLKADGTVKRKNCIHFLTMKVCCE